MASSMHPAHSISRIKLVTPVYNDWESFGILLRALDAEAATLGCSLSVYAVDDGSTQEPGDLQALAGQLRFIEKIEIIHLALNVGHQRAIAIGLCATAEEDDCDAVLVMDSDGEDPPASIASLLESTGGKREFCIVAARRKRSERFTFRAGYIIYKTLFKAVTGNYIDFGNFSLLSIGYARRLTMQPDLWNNLAAAVLRSRFPIQKVYIDRGKRYAGKSKMNFNSLIVHGFSTISVYSDAIFVRLLITTIALMGFTALAIAFVVTLRIFYPQHATPGWATTVSAGMIIILLQVLFAAFTSLLMLLNSRTQRLMLPAIDYKPYIRNRYILRAASRP
jgi:polyisoprenyl-phosphate glycosyltransferase